MALSEYAAIVRSRLGIVVAATLAAAVAAVLGSSMLEPTYSASATLRTATGVSISGGLVRPDDATHLDRLKNTYARIATSDLLVRRLMRDLDLTTRPQARVDHIPNSELTRVIVAVDRPELAPRAANRLAELLIGRVAEITASDIAKADARYRARANALGREIAATRREYDALRRSGDDEAIEARLLQLADDIELKKETAARLQEEHERNRLARADRAAALVVLEPAAPPAAKSGPKQTTIVGLGVVVGLIGGLGLAFLLENLNRRVHGTKEIEQVIQVPVIAAIPSVRGARYGARFNSGSAGEEAFRRLATNLFPAALERGVRTILVTSAEPGAGKSTVVANLGAALVEAGASVVAVDADLRRPQLHTILGGSRTSGLSGVLDGVVTLDDALQPTPVQHLSFLASGPTRVNPALLLRGSALEELIRELEGRFDIVLIDAPALLGVTDALLLARCADGVLLVVRDDVARREAVQAARDNLARMSAETLGVVLNRAREFEGQRYYEQLVRPRWERRR